ncbi:hypothetical protein BRADI_3g47853v3 [Brachypodium distachyon]|uniref:Uncharacterized protein n=1 Tax=Brachypodium distachyon TaxID=15368 RepID=A0A0Q3I2V2_BRADI|nr:hypothetical protein BRADI_3g47853v3 [Brachypodium distachyon]
MHLIMSHFHSLKQCLAGRIDDEESGGESSLF